MKWEEFETDRVESIKLRFKIAIEEPVREGEMISEPIREPIRESQLIEGPKEALVALDKLLDGSHDLDESAEVEQLRMEIIRLRQEIEKLNALLRAR